MLYKRELEEKIAEEKDEEKKAKLEIKLKNLEENNLGYKKRKAKVGRYKSRIFSHINHEINKMIEEEDLREVVREDLNWVSKKNNVSKKQQNKRNIIGAFIN